MTYAITTLGCKVNTYESNVIINLLNKAGYKQVSFNTITNIYIINTCTVTNIADNKSLKLIRKAISQNKEAIIIAIGCLVQTNIDAVMNLENIDIILGNKNKTNIVSYIESYLKNKKQIIDVQDINNTSFEPMQIDDFNKTRAFVKIQDGCNNFCSFCIIPYARGNIRSKNIDEVILEVEKLVVKNYQEIVLTGINTGAYGVDINTNLVGLLKKLSLIKNLKRIRISSIEITEITDELLELMDKNSIIVDHLHIPLQSGSDKILTLMNRKYDVKYFIDKIKKIRKIRPNILITTDVIVGFPGEEENDFLDTIDTIKKISFHKLHVFPYSKRNNTKAAMMENQIDNVIKKERVRKLLKLSLALEMNNLNKFIGQKLSFIPEVYKDGYLIGHAGNYLTIKVKGKKEELDKEILVIIKEIMYPFCIGEKLNA